MQLFFFIDGPAFPAGSRLYTGFESASRGEVQFRSLEPPPRGEWFDMSRRITLNTSDVVAIRTWIEVPTGSWAGSIYYDDIKLVPE